MFILLIYQNCPALAMKYLFLIHNKAVFRTATGTAGSYVTGTVSWKNRCQNFSNVHRSRKHWKCKYTAIIQYHAILAAMSRIHVCYMYFMASMSVAVSQAGGGGGERTPSIQLVSPLISMSP